MRFSLVLSLMICSTLSTNLAHAQTLSAADILAQVDQKVGGLNEYQVLLNDPDPQRSMAAMEIMLGSGDATLERMALDYGLYSPNPVVQRMALDAFFKSGPNLAIFMSAEDISRAGGYIQNAGGSIQGKTDGYLNIRVGKFDDAENCYTDEHDNDCFVRLSDTGVSVALWRKWKALNLDEQGQLVGVGDLPGTENVSFRIPVSK